MGPDPVPHQETAPGHGEAAAAERGESVADGPEARTGPGEAGARSREVAGGRGQAGVGGREDDGARGESGAGDRDAVGGGPAPAGGRVRAGARREVVTAEPGSPRAGRPSPRAAAAPGDGAPAAGLMRRQLRAALTAVALLAVPLGLLPLLPAGTGPDVPLAVWLALGVAPYPVLLGAGAWYVRRAERNEGDVTGR